MVGSAINRDTAELVGDMEAMPVWSTPYFYIINSEGDDLLGRPLPPGVQQLLPKLTEDSPFGKVSDEHRRIFGRFLSLNDGRSEEHTSELQSRGHLVCRLLLEKKKKIHRSD